MKRFGLVVAVLASTIGMAGAASAATTTTYHGLFTGPVVYQGCATTPPTAIAHGTWNVALHGASDATVTVNIFVNGKHHVSFGGTVPQLAPENGQTFAVAIPTQAGPLAISLLGNAFMYRIAPYDLFGISCESVTYTGALSG